MVDDVHLRRAAAGGRRLLRRVAPPAVRQWLDALARQSALPASVEALGGFLAAMGIELHRAFRRSGADVRTLILNLHRLVLTAEADPVALPPAMRPFVPWVTKHLLASREGSNAGRTILFRWIEAMSERLTLQRYSRLDHRTQQARALLVGPIELLGLSGGASESSLANWADLMLGFFDHLEAPNQARWGRDRLTNPAGEQLFGGFFSLSETVAPPDAAAMERSLDRLHEAMVAFAADEASRGLPPALATLSAEAIEAVRFRRATGRWPSRFSAPAEGLGLVRRWWRRLRRKGD